MTRASRLLDTIRVDSAGVLPAVAAVVLALLLPSIAAACPVCYGDPNSPLSKGTSNGVWVLLGIVGFVQAGFIALFFSFWKRARDLRRHRESFKIVDGGVV